ncbi:alpha/beta hydrolase [Erythrobacter sp. HKB08]|uniref:alpha/beta hydrolase n=1 Tax=Erythrobacter sp. HKB08 TaxID=2502843 RepID=UPI001009326C|nr:alpha/beta hydrolase [Erythrobacter sp. HKB08]
MSRPAVIERAFDKPSLRLRIAKTLFKLLPEPFPPADEIRQKLAEREPPQAAPMPKAVEKQFVVEKKDHGGIPVYRLTPRSGASDWHIVYLHGGGYVNPMHAVHWGVLRALGEATGATITLPLYPLAPEHDYKPGRDLVLGIYDQIRSENPQAKIALAGDSAGGNFALGTAIRLREAGKQQADALVLFSPWMDLTLADERARAVEEHDIMLGVDRLRICGEMWAGEDDPSRVDLSPLHAELAGLPPMAIFQGTHDLLCVDARSFAERAGAEGHDVRYAEYEGAFHDFMIATFTREAKNCYARVAEFLKAKA